MSVYAESGPFEMIPHWILAEASANGIRLYLILRRYAMDKGACFPARSTLAAEMGVSLNTLDRAKTELIGLGAVSAVARVLPDGSQTSNEYTVHWNRGGSKGEDPPSPSLVTPPPQNVATKETTLKETRNTLAPSAQSPTFKDFWSAYPLRKDRIKAEAAWKKIPIPSRLDVIAAVPVYVADCKRCERPLKYPATWLNAGSWLDEYEPATPNVVARLNLSTADPIPIENDERVCQTCGFWLPADKDHSHEGSS